MMSGKPEEEQNRIERERVITRVDHVVSPLPTLKVRPVYRNRKITERLHYL
jgi:hypothetical protein